MTESLHGIQRLSSRAVSGMLGMAMEQDIGVPWVDQLSIMAPSDQAGEDQSWIGNAPAMREWIGGRHAKAFKANSIYVPNRHFEATVEIPVPWMRRDKTGMIRLKINELAARANSHWASLLSALIANGEAGIGYDGVPYYSTSHPRQDTEGREQGLVQSNQITVSLATLPAQVQGTPTNPSPEQMQQCIMKGISQIKGFLDDQGQPMNELATNFIIQVPISLYIVATNALLMPREAGISVNRNPPSLTFDVVDNARLGAWTDRFVVFRADSQTGPLLRQQETEPDIKMKAEDSDYAFDNDAHQYGVDTWRNADYAYWEYACEVIMEA